MKDHLDEELKRFQPGTLCYLDTETLGFRCECTNGVFSYQMDESDVISGPFLLIFVRPEEKILAVIGLWNEAMYWINFWWPVNTIHIYEDYIKEEG